MALDLFPFFSRLFARKFDPKDTEVFDVLDRVRNGEQPWRKGPTFDFISIRSSSPPTAAGDGIRRMEVALLPLLLLSFL